MGRDAGRAARWRACNGDFRYPVPGPGTLVQHAVDMLDDVQLGPDILNRLLPSVPAVTVATGRPARTVAERRQRLTGPRVRLFDPDLLRVAFWLVLAGGVAYQAAELFLPMRADARGAALMKIMSSTTTNDLITVKNHKQIMTGDPAIFVLETGGHGDLYLRHERGQLRLSYAFCGGVLAHTTAPRDFDGTVESAVAAFAAVNVPIRIGVPAGRF